MGKGRLEAFSDGVLAIVITIMVLELSAPEEPTLAALRPLIPTFLSYALSFVFVGIYWNNHHHLFQAVKQVDGRILWANLHLLFWLSLFPFVTAWMGENHFAAVPSALYGAVLMAAAVAWMILQQVIVRSQGPASRLQAALGTDWKGVLSPVLYATAVLLSFWRPWVAQALYAAVALMWLVPDRRIESSLQDPHG